MAKLKDCAPLVIACKLLVTRCSNFSFLILAFSERIFSCLTEFNEKKTFEESQTRFLVQWTKMDVGHETPCFARTVNQPDFFVGAEA